MHGPHLPTAAGHPYCGAAPDPGAWLGHWNFDPWLIGAVVAALAFGLARRRATARAQVLAAVTVLVLFVTPLCALGSALFTARAAHHLALALVLAPALAEAAGPRVRPRWPLAWLTALSAAVFWLWHAPPLYAAALSHDGVFWAMQISITATAAAWWAALRRAGALEAAAAVLAQMVQMGVLGALLVFAGRAFYAPHFATTAPWGLSALEDQQVAGLVMWVVGGGAYLLLAAALVWRALAPGPAPAAASRPA